MTREVLIKKIEKHRIKLIYAQCLFILMTYSSCIENGEKTGLKVESPEVVVDSLKLEKNDDQGNLRAYDNLFFGMEKNEVNKLLKERTLNAGKSSYKIQPFFDDNNELFVLVFKGNPLTIADYCNISSLDLNSSLVLFMEFSDSRKNLEYLISNKYGSVSKIGKNRRHVELDVHCGKLSINEESDSYNISYWKLKRKEIVIGFRISDSKVSLDEPLQLFKQFYSSMFEDLSSDVKIFPILAIYDTERMSRYKDLLNKKSNQIKEKEKRDFDDISNKF